MEKIKQEKWFQTTLKVLKHPVTKVVFTLILVYISNFYLQMSQNNWDMHLAYKFATSWHVEKFLLGTLVLLILDAFLIAFSGSFLVGNSFYGLSILLLGIANFEKMSKRMEPIYPDDLKMIIEWTMLKDMIGTFYFVIAMILIFAIIALFAYSIYKSRKLSKNTQIVRLIIFTLSFSSLIYIDNFNKPNNLLRKAYDKTALWIPYSQKMNYYNTGFMGGFLYNLSVEAMDKPEGYSKEKMEAIVDKYNKQANEANELTSNSEQPNIIFLMSESFSDPNNLAGIDLNKNPIKPFQEIASQSLYSGEMLSQNYGGGTANIEFEALTGFSMEVLNSQMTTPYTMMLPKQKSFPSVVSNLSNQGYETVAIHPYNTSMYKRKDVYNVLGFNTFLDESTMTHQEKLSPNGYISDESAFNEVLDILSTCDKPVFTHLVTMQTHMPYNTKYTHSDYELKDGWNDPSITNYAQDIAYTSEALDKLVEDLNQLDRRTILVFWGDHLPSIYPEEIVKENEPIKTHLTEYFIYDTKQKISPQVETLSPFYFSSLMTQAPGMKQTGFNALMLELYHIMPAFEKRMYLYDNKWQEDINLPEKENGVLEDYRLVMYDTISGERYGNQLFDVVN